MNKASKQRWITHERVLKNGLISFGRNVWLAVAAIAMMAVTLSILLFLIIANSTLNHSIQNITGKIDVTAYLKDSDSQAQIDKLKSDLEALPSVQSVGYTSKAQALADYRAQNANNVNLLEAISETNNPLPASLKVKPKDPNNLQPIRDFLSQPANLALQTDSNQSSDNTRRQAVDKIAHAAHFFQQAGIAGIIVFVVVSMMIIFNTIRMAIFNRREELTIMRLLGATTWYIRGPFVIETMVYGMLAAIVSIFVCYLIFVVGASGLNASALGLLDIGYSHTFISNHLSQIILGQILVGILIGAVSSTIATRRYLKFKSN